jgi:hypothetical protein
MPGQANAEDGLHLLAGQVADLEDAGLLGLDQEQRALLHLGRHRGGDANLVDAFGHRLGRNAQVDVDLRLLLLSRIAGEMRLLQRQVLQIHALDVEDGIALLRLGHGDGFPMKQTRSGCGLERELSRRPLGAQVGLLAEQGRRPPRGRARSGRRSRRRAVADEDLRHRAAPGQRDHRRALRRVEIDPHLVDRSTPRCLQQGLGALAVRADLRGVHATGSCGVQAWQARDCPAPNALAGRRLPTRRLRPRLFHGRLASRQAAATGQRRTFS